MPKDSEKTPLAKSFWKKRGFGCNNKGNEDPPLDEVMRKLDSQDLDHVLSILDEQDPPPDFVGRH